ncbi:lymphocyte expansion molecule-like [Aricia agestis]|uniref:lymphocyte expansion molecule-like n=1 Tax=Aricia agestis TaxID=91739 RepID=UPI001C20A7F0|nr:lymphocyte expansion molecule-like [Aricia agestis]
MDRSLPASINTAPFGSGSPRFGKITLHPCLDRSGLYTKRPQACDPCLYRPKDTSKICEYTKINQTGKGPWRHKIELEEWAKNLGYRNTAILRERKWFKSILGPAWYERKDAGSIAKSPNFSKNLRFITVINNAPPPGTYHRAKSYKAPYGPHSSIPSFEWSEPCRFRTKIVDWSIAPNRYKVKDGGSIEEKSRTVVSTRGPYDLFTGPRDNTTIRNRFSSSKCVSATWPTKLKDTLARYEKSHFGEMNKTNRESPYRGRNALVDLSLCLKRAEDPSPAHYTVNPPTVLKEWAYPFNSSYDKPRGHVPATVCPGVGRYNIKTKHCIKGHGHKHVFLSKQGRTIGANLPQPLNSF